MALPLQPARSLDGGSALHPGLPLLEAGRIGLRVGRRALLHDFSLHIDAGQRWCLLGPNGAGKSQLLECLIGLRPPQSGQLAYAGRPLRQWGLQDMARFRAFLPQHLELPFDLSVKEIVLAGRHPHRKRDRQEGASVDAALETPLEALALAPLRERRIHSLSGGERQRVALAACLAQQTRLLLLDEPLNHLDPRYQQTLLACLRQRSLQGVGVLLSLHDPNQAAQFATHVILMDGKGGALVGPCSDVLGAPQLSHAFDLPFRALQSGERIHFITESGA